MVAQRQVLLPKHGLPQHDFCQLCLYHSALATNVCCKERRIKYPLVLELKCQRPLLEVTLALWRGMLSKINKF